MRTCIGTAALVCALSGSAMAADVSVTISNPQGGGGFALTPFFLGFHDGGFDVFDPGVAASGGITEIAELGDTSVLADRFDLEQPGGVQTTLAEGNGAPVFSPGESATAMFDLDPVQNRFLNLASMVVPSNDLFVGNPMGVEIFDDAGNFNGPITINIFGSMVWDNGSEVNDITNGPAFVMGQDATAGAAEGGVVSLFFNDPGAAAYLDSIVGITTANGDTITGAFDADTLIAQITIIPAPGGAALAGLAAFGVMRRRRA